MPKKYANKTTVWTWRQACKDDMLGFCEGAAAGGAVGALWGAACGGLSFGLYESYKDYLVVPNPISNPTGTLNLSNNPYEHIGKIHNSGLLSSLVNFGALPDHTFADYYAFEKNFILSSVPTVDSPYYDSVYFSLQQFASLLSTFTQLYNSQSIGGDPINYMDYLLDQQSISQDFYDFWVLNYSTLFDLENVNSVTAYYSELVDIILVAEDLSPYDKALILKSASLNAYAYYFHLYNEI